MDPGDDGQNEINEIDGMAVEGAFKDAFPGGYGKVGVNTGPDIMMANRQYSSVLQQAMRSINDDKDYRQALGLARWLSEDAWADWCAAYHECKRYGVAPDFLIDRLIAQSAGIDGGKLKAIFETISHTTFTTNYMGKKQGAFGFLRRGNRNGDNGTGPLPK